MPPIFQNISTCLKFYTKSQILYNLAKVIHIFSIHAFQIHIENTMMSLNVYCPNFFPRTISRNVSTKSCVMLREQNQNIVTMFHDLQHMFNLDCQTNFTPVSCNNFPSKISKNYSTKSFFLPSIQNRNSVTVSSVETSAFLIPFLVNNKPSDLSNTISKGHLPFQMSKL